MQKGRLEAFSGGVLFASAVAFRMRERALIRVAVTLNNGRKKALYQLSIAAIFVHIALLRRRSGRLAVPAKKLERSIEKQYYRIALSQTKRI